MRAVTIAPSSGTAVFYKAKRLFFPFKLFQAACKHQRTELLRKKSVPVPLTMCKFYPWTCSQTWC